VVIPIVRIINYDKEIIVAFSDFIGRGCTSPVIGTVFNSGMRFTYPYIHITVPDTPITIQMVSNNLRDVIERNSTILIDVVFYGLGDEG